MDIRIVDGRLTRDAEVKVNKNNNRKYLTFTIANNGFSRGEQITTYFNVLSYNEHDISRIENLTKGKLVVITGKPNEIMTVKDGKTYLNRSIMANSIESGTYSTNKESNQSVSVYHDVAPAPSSVEAPNVVRPVVEAPNVAQPVIEMPITVPPKAVSEKKRLTNQVYEAQIDTNTSNDDDLPF